MSPMLGLGAVRWVPGSSLSPERPARGRRAHPAPCARHPLPLEENNRSGTPFRLPSRREPNFLYLGRGGGLYAKGARPEPTLAPAGEERRGWALPKPIPPREAARSLGDSCARQRAAAAAGRYPCPCPPAAPSRAPGLEHPQERGEPEGPAAKLQNAGSPRRPRLATLGAPVCFPVFGADARAAIAAFFYPLQNEGESRAGER